MVSFSLRTERLELRPVRDEDIDRILEYRNLPEVTRWLLLQVNEEPYDIVLAVRVGALDGRHPETGQRVLQRIAAATTADARLFIDGGEPLRELPIPRH